MRLAAIICILGFLLLQPAWSQTFTVAQARQLGQVAMQQSTTPKFRSDSEKARFIMDRLGRRLALAKVKPNGSFTGRMRAGLTSGSLTQGNCQWSAEMLKEALIGAGIDPRNLVLVYGRVKGTSVMGLNPIEVNWNHCALAVMVNGQPVVYDLWKHGMVTGSFTGAAKGKWCGITFPQWAVRLQNYEWFGWEGDKIASTDVKTVSEAAEDLALAHKLLLKPKPADAAAQPSQATGRLVSGTYPAVSNGHAMTWELTVTNGQITGKTDWDEKLTGSVDGASVRLRRECPGFDPPYQIYKGVIKGNQIVGTFTGAGGEPGVEYDWSLSLTNAVKAPAATSKITSDRYEVTANGFPMIWEISISGGKITGMSNDSERLTGSIEGNTVRIRRELAGYDPPYQDFVGVIQEDRITGTFTGAGGGPDDRFDWELRLK